eukprot:CAMPEP_0114149190 /NCGR_PEP_ID=MMETSP0043_2-20121206/22024_1 /TAXON_ID=464988 /ORGANISM="Hemiselmis andersenii, Strain CCMP644" /LENGTH=96 /DNA_ID=CAMNT_0001243811 /DNA_START=219 /DNA_END=506 /DNA_ORIENTATION=+
MLSGKAALGSRMLPFLHRSVVGAASALAAGGARRCSTATEAPAAVIIPARFGSTRFPGKPLAPIRGQPMIVHTMQRAKRAHSVQLVAVATDHRGIM